jgi:exopolysaccharide biosynthesis polyprenyl glycosylphosphotransferase
VTRNRSIEQIILLEDVAVVVASLLLSRLIHVRLASSVPGLKPPIPFGEYAHLLLVFLPTWTFAAERFGIHHLRTLTGSRLETIRRVLMTQAWGATAIAFILVAAQTALNRSLIAIFAALSTLLLLLSKTVQRRWVFRNRGQSVALLIGDEPEDVVAEIAHLRGRRVERCASDDPAVLAARLRAGPVDEVVLARALPPERMQRLVALCAEAGLPTVVRIDHGHGAPADLALPLPVVETAIGTPYLVYQTRELDAPALFVKAVLDRTLALVLVVLLSPILALVALAVRISLGSPVLYIQRRGGLFGRPFAMLKFRTMGLGAEAQRDALLAHNQMDGPVFKMANDPRVTPLGRILRRCSLDELPQLFNVLAGHMSLVGPRPLPLAETQALHGGHRRRLAMRPGLTCLWQVSGRNNLTFAEWMTLDLEYVDRWTLSLDLALLLRTIPAIITGRGAR